MDVGFASHFLSVVLTEGRESSTNASSSSVTSVVSIGDKSGSRAPPPLLPIVSSSKDNDRKSRLKEEKKYELNVEEIWDVTRRLPKTLLAECTIEIHKTPPHRMRKVPQQLCFDARVYPIFSNPPAHKILGDKKCRSVIPNIYHANSDNQNGETEDDDQGMNNAFELIEAVYSDNDSEHETGTGRNDVSQSSDKTLRVLKKSDLLKKHVSEMAVRSTPKISFKCEHCPNVYPNRGALWQHRVATHSVEKNCECKICGRKFYRNCSLALHLKSHSEEKLSACKNCGKSFSKLAHLEHHMKICGKLLPTIGQLPLQNTTHVFKRRFVCTFCNKFFSQKSVFKKHLTIHVGENLKCNTCGIEFTQRSSLLRHLKRMHCSEPVKQNVPVLELNESEFSVVMGSVVDVTKDILCTPKEEAIDCNYNNHKEGNEVKGFGFYLNQPQETEKSLSG